MTFGRLILPGLQGLEVPVRDDRPTGRVYVLSDGTELPSVTSVLGRRRDAGLDAWIASVDPSVAEWVSKRALRIGSDLHSMAESYLIDGTLPSNPIARWRFGPLRRAFDEHLGLVVGAEIPLWSRTLGAAGRVDLIAEWDGKLSIVDFKTAGSEFKTRDGMISYFAQTAAYGSMLSEHARVPMPQTVIVLLVEGETSARIFVTPGNETVADLEYFRECLAL